VGQDKLVEDGSAVGGRSPVLAVGHAVTSAEAHDQGHVEKRGLGGRHSRWERKPQAWQVQIVRDSSPRL